jgi:predicted MFS family arabinose efflux permease
MGRGTVFLFGVAAAVAVGNLYYIQPLLNLIASGFGVSHGTAGLLVAVIQVGYLAGLALIVPAGDMLDRHRLIAAMFVLCGVAAVCCAVAPTIATLAIALAALGTLAVVAQVVLPYAAALAAPEQQGEVVGTILGCALIGILLARIASGLIAELGGWRLVYLCAAVVMALLALLLYRLLPREVAQNKGPYRAVLRSVFRLIGEEPVLRQRMFLGACIHACFSILWTSLTFLLGSSAYGYGEGVIGLFGFAGLAGVLIAPLSGKFVDRGHIRLATTLFLCELVASWGLLFFGRSSLIALILGIVFLDMAIQGTHINNQATIYGLRAGAGSRLITGYQVSIFIGLIVGSALASLLYEAAGWEAVCAAGAAFALLALAVWVGTRGRGFAASGERLAPSGQVE